ncbi:MAG: biotin-dependent carboxyltransferase family protein [Chitinophagaceae bacterium]|nr:biotin-dependent carboxyltransferase family protein [Chitinophagaceae bacterium]
MSALIEKAGVMDTVQDCGRHGYSHLGVGPAGPMDEWAASAANALVGNHLDAALLELHFPAATIRFLQPALIAMAGADFGTSINNIPITVCRTVWVPAGSRLHFSVCRQGQRLYLAVAGGWQVPTVLGSRAVQLAAGIGGRRLMAGDELPFQPAAADHFHALHLFPWKAVPPPVPAAVGVVPGPEWHWLSPAAQATLLSQPFQLSAASNRMALRWQGPPLAPDESESIGSMLSSPVIKGTMQLLPSGQLLTLMADHQTVGGYPRVLQVVRADLSFLAQLMPGASIYWQLSTMEAAAVALLQQQQQLAKLAAAVRFQLAAFK